MIERYFIQGVRLDWNVPIADGGGNRDGSIVDNPATIAGTMSYEGLDEELYTRFMSSMYTMAAGMYVNMTIPYNWLVYKLGHTTQLALTADTLTGFMSGCWIVTWTDRGIRYVGHIGTVESSATVNADVRQTFRDMMPADVQGYNPADMWDFGEIKAMMGAFAVSPTANIVSLVTAGGDFHSIVLFKMAMNKWCVGGIKKATPTGYAQLMTKLGG